MAKPTEYLHACAFSKRPDIVWGPGVAGAALSAAMSAAGALANLHLDSQALRPVVALACGALAATVVLAERWAAAPERLGRGAAAAAFASALAALGASIS
jgi:uncharacterized membrane protein YfcA